MLVDERALELALVGTLGKGSRMRSLKKIGQGKCIIIIIIPLTCCISQRLCNTLQKSVDLTQKGPSNTR